MTHQKSVASIVNKIDDRGWYVCMLNGLDYLYTDGEIRDRASLTAENGATAFWETKEAAELAKSAYNLSIQNPMVDCRVCAHWLKCQPDYFVYEQCRNGDKFKIGAPIYLYEVNCG